MVRIQTFKKVPQYSGHHEGVCRAIRQVASELLEGTIVRYILATKCIFCFPFSELKFHGGMLQLNKGFAADFTEIGESQLDCADWEEG